MPSELHLKATGIVRTTDAETTFTISGWPTAFPLGGAGDLGEGQHTITASIFTKGNAVRFEIRKKEQ